MQCRCPILRAVQLSARGLHLGKSPVGGLWGRGTSKNAGSKRSFISKMTAHHEMTENTGSTARDHLANERTFLAWCRTGMSFLGAGLALFSSYELLDDQSTTRTGVPGSSRAGKLTGHKYPQECAEEPESRGGWKVVEPTALMVGNGGIFVTYATWNYFRVQHCIHKGLFPRNKIGLLLVVVSTSLSSCLALYLIANDKEHKHNPRAGKRGGNLGGI